MMSSIEGCKEININFRVDMNYLQLCLNKIIQCEYNLRGHDIIRIQT